MQLDGAVGVSVWTEDLGDTEVDQLQVVAAWLHEKQVFWLDVSVDDLLAVHILDSFHQLREVVPGLFLGVACTFLGDPFEEFSSVAQSGYASCYSITK